MRSIGMPELLVILGIWLVPAVLSGVVVSKRGGNTALWLILGFIAGPLAPLVLVLAIALNQGKLCPFCRKRIDKEASKCAYCQSDLRQSNAT